MTDYQHKSLAFLNKIEPYAYRYDLFFLLRKFEAESQPVLRIGEAKHLKQDPLRLRQEPELIFSPSNVYSVVVDNGRGISEIKIRGFGLFGPNGPLPIHITEYAYDRKHNYNDFTMSAFADIFHNRLIGLFYRAWSGAQDVNSLDNGDQWSFSRYIGSLIGIGTRASTKQGFISDYAKYYYSCFLWSRKKSPLHLQKIIQSYFGVPVSIKENMGFWQKAPAEMITKLQRGQSNYLGNGLLLGDKVYNIQSKFRIVLGPLKLNEYKSFFKDGKNAKKIEDWVQFFCSIEYDWDVKLILKQESVPKFKLGKNHSLGRLTWLGKVSEDRGDLTINYQ